MAGTNGKGGRPPDHELRARILATHQAHPELRTHQAVAAAVGCSVRTVARCLPKLRQAGHRMSIPAELYARAEARGGVLAVLEAALATPAPQPAPFPGVRDRWVPPGRE